MINITILPYMHHSAYCDGSNASDYQLDMVYHGLSQLPDVQVQQLPPNPVMFQICPEHELRKVWGKGMTLYGLLPYPRVKFEVEDSDLIILALHHTACNDQHGFYLAVKEMVEKFGRDKICVIDGSDRTEYSDETAGLCKYFKRELLDDRTTALPLFFAIPEEHFWPTIPDKTEPRRRYEFSPIIPANFCWNTKHTENYFKYDNQDDYYEHYRQSYFGFLSKKGGIQTGRTLEVIANNCMPYFLDIERYPKNTMHNFPKQLCIEAKKIKGVYPGTTLPYNPEIDTYIGDARQININNEGGYIDFNIFEFDKYYSLLKEIKTICKSKMTTKKLAAYLLEHTF